MTRLRLIHSPDFDRDLPDHGHEPTTTCDACGKECSPRQRTCDECHWGPQGGPLHVDSGPEHDSGDDEPDDAGEP